MCECALSTANKCTKHAKIMRAYCPNLFPINCINKTQKKAEVKKRERNAKRNLRHLFTGERRTNPDLHGLASGSAFDGSCRGGVVGFSPGSWRVRRVRRDTVGWMLDAAERQKNYVWREIKQ